MLRTLLINGNIQLLSQRREMLLLHLTHPVIEGRSLYPELQPRTIPPEECFEDWETPQQRIKPCIDTHHCHYQIIMTISTPPR